MDEKSLENIQGLVTTFYRFCGLSAWYGFRAQKKKPSLRLGVCGFTPQAKL
jgi:hypothetical protein